MWKLKNIIRDPFKKDKFPRPKPENSKPKLGFVPWIKSQEYTIESLRKLDIFDIEEINLSRIFEDKMPRELQGKNCNYQPVRMNIATIAIEMKNFYIRRIKKFIRKTNIDCLIITQDWTPPHRYVVEAFQELNLPTVCIPHEGVFAKSDLWFVNPSSGNENLQYNKPLADRTFVWGELQKQIFLDRGYPEEKIVLTGSPKFDEYFNYKPTFDKEEFCKRYRFDQNKKTILYVVQIFDVQFDTELALRRQAEAVLDIINIAEKHGHQVLIRMYPSRSMDILGEEIKKLNAQPSKIFFIDGEAEGSPRLTTPIESIYFSDLVISFNSTMLMEAAFLHKPSLSIHYVDFECLWTKFGEIPLARNAIELEEQISKCIGCNHTTFTDKGYHWMINAFQGGGADGKAAVRIADEILRTINAYRETQQKMVRP